MHEETYQDLEKNHLKGLNGKVCIYTRLRIVPASPGKKPSFMHSALGKVLPQQWEITSPRLSITPGKPNKA